MKSFASHWWVRILVTLVLSIPIVVAWQLIALPKLWTSFFVLLSFTGLLLYIEHVRGSMRTSGLGWHTNAWRLLAIGTGLAAGIIAVLLATSLALGASLTLTHPITTSLYAALLIVAIQSAMEEVLFRGTMFEAIHERFGAATAVLGTSILFGIAHVFNPSANALSTLNTILAGVVLGVLVTHTHSLYAAITFHITWNVLVGMVVGNVSGFDFGIGFARIDYSNVLLPWLFGYAYGIEEGALTTGLLLLAVFLVLRFAPIDAETRDARYRRSFSESLPTAQ